MPSFRAWLALARWPNVLIAAGGVAVGAWWARGPFALPVLWGALAAVCITAAANAWNDVADLAIDRTAHPGRPLPSGTLAPDDATRFAWAAAGLALPLSALAARPLGAITLGVLTLARAYSPWLKRAGLVGNVVVATLASLPFLYGAWAVGRPGAGLLLVAIAMPLHLAREIAKDLDDAEADAATRRTLPVVRGVRSARLAVVTAAVLFLVALAPPALRAPAFALALIPAVALAVAAAHAALRGYRGSPGLFKAAMVCAMLAVLAARP